MEALKYSGIIAETAVYPRQVNNFGVAYAFIGMYDEMQEVREKIWVGNVSEAHTERFDVVWYICALCNELDIDFPAMVQQYFDIRDEGLENYEKDFYFGKIKKFYRDGKVIDKRHITENFLLPFMHELFISYDQKSFEQGLQENYDKLMSRRQNGTIHGDGDKR